MQILKRAWSLADRVHLSPVVTGRHNESAQVSMVCYLTLSLAFAFVVVSLGKRIAKSHQRLFSLDMRFYELLSARISPIVFSTCVITARRFCTW